MPTSAQIVTPGSATIVKLKPHRSWRIGSSVPFDWKEKKPASFISASLPTDIYTCELMLKELM